MNIDDFLAAYPYADETKRTYRAVLERVFGQCAELATLSAVGLLTIIQGVGWGNARQCMALAASQKYLAWRFGQLHPALYAKLKRIEGKPMRSLSKEQADILLASFDTYTAKGARDLAIASVALQTALRASELCNLKQEYIDTEHCFLQSLTKGGKWRFGIFDPDTAAHIEHWKLYRNGLNPQKGLLFVSTSNWGKNKAGHGLTPEGLNQIVRQWGNRIGIQLSPHDFRRSFATLTSENGGPDHSIMEGGGWHSQESFNRYTRNVRMETLRKFLPPTKIKEILIK